MNALRSASKPVKIVGTTLLLLGVVMSTALVRVFSILYQPVTAENQYDLFQVPPLLALGLLGPILIAIGSSILIRTAKSKDTKKTNSRLRG